MTTSKCNRSNGSIMLVIIALFTVFTLQSYAQNDVYYPPTTPKFSLPQEGKTLNKNANNELLLQQKPQYQLPTQDCAILNRQANQAYSKALNAKAKGDKQTALQNFQEAQKLFEKAYLCYQLKDDGDAMTSIAKLLQDIDQQLQNGNGTLERPKGPIVTVPREGKETTNPTPNKPKDGHKTTVPKNPVIVPNNCGCGDFDVQITAVNLTQNQTIINSNQHFDGNNTNKKRVSIASNAGNKNGDIIRVTFTNIRPQCLNCNVGNCNPVAPELLNRNIRANEINRLNDGRGNTSYLSPRVKIVLGENDAATSNDNYNLLRVRTNKGKYAAGNASEGWTSNTQDTFVMYLKVDKVQNPLKGEGRSYQKVTFKNYCKNDNCKRSDLCIYKMRLVIR